MSCMGSREIIKSQPFHHLDISTVARVTAEEFLTSKMTWMQLSDHYTLVGQQQLVGLELSHVTHTRVHRTGLRPGVTTDEILSQNSDTVSKFHPPKKQPNRDELILTLIVQGLDVA